MAMDRVAIASKAFSHQLERVDSLKNLVNDGINTEMEYLRKLGGNEDEGIEFYADEAYELTDVDKLFTQLTVVALYAALEISAKRVLAHKCSPAQLRGAFKWRELKSLFKQLAGSDLAALPHFADVDELRCLNNAIKHNGTVSAELAGFPGWTLDEQIGDVRPTVDRVRAALPTYFAAFAAAILHDAV